MGLPSTKLLPTSRTDRNEAIMTRPVKIPGPDHPITVTPFAGRIVVKAGGKVVADSRRAHVLQESFYPPVHYIPRSDADAALLIASDHTTYCPYKGDCSYFSLPDAENAVWMYAQPYAAVAGIKDHIAFYPNRVDSIELLVD
jgi:uncharacterized protein (DUF427 family)